MIYNKNSFIINNNNDNNRPWRKLWGVERFQTFHVGKEVKECSGKIFSLGDFVVLKFTIFGASRNVMNNYN
jgi:hypothetical protein